MKRGAAMALMLLAMLVILLAWAATDMREREYEWTGHGYEPVQTEARR